MEKTTDIRKIGFGGGCHWCTEAVFQHLKGVISAEQGWIKSAPPHDSFSEAVIVTYDSARIDLSVLIDVHIRTHASQSQHSMRGKYRSAIYTYDLPQALICQDILKALQPEFENPLIVQILPMHVFEASTETYQNYYLENPDRQFCKTYIDPKLSYLRKKFSKHAISA